MMEWEELYERHALLAEAKGVFMARLRRPSTCPRVSIQESILEYQKRDMLAWEDPMVTS